MLGGYGLLHLSGRVRLGTTTSLDLSIRNALNRRYPELVAGHVYSPGQPRTLNGGVTVAFWVSPHADTVFAESRVAHVARFSRSTHRTTVMPSDVVFLLDVDNTLLDNDRVILDLREYLENAFGADRASRYWSIFEALREEIGYADYLGALQLYRNLPDPGLAHQHQLLMMSSYLFDYPFADRLYPGALDAIRYLSQFGKTVILSDGDVVFQPRKVQRSGIWDAVEGRVLIYIHKEEMLDSVQQLYPAQHYVMVDDKVRLLDAMKTVMGSRLTTVFPRQGHYALDVESNARYMAPDVTISRIGELVGMDLLK